MVDFETEYRKWMDGHLSKRKGERLRMLKEQHGFSEKLFVQEVWWPVVGNLNMLHPEYEIMDDEGNYYYLDFAYIRFPKAMDVEADGYNSHAREADRNRFSKGRRRQNSILLDNWNLLRFSVDDLKEDPAYCRQTLRRAFEEWYDEDRQDWLNLPLEQREIMRVASRSPKPVRPRDVAPGLGSSEQHARKLLHQLIESGYLEPGSGQKRIHSYRVVQRTRENRRTQRRF